MLDSGPFKGCRPFDGDEVKKMVAAFSARGSYRDICLFVLGVSSGFRISEMLALRVEDVMEDGEVTEWLSLRQTKTRDTRQVKLGADELSAIGAQVAALRRAGHYSGRTMLFRSRQGRNKAVSRERAYRIIRDTARGLGMRGKIGTHSMRKTFANNTFEAIKAMGGEDAVISTARAGGWKSVDAFVRYLSFRIGPMLRAKEVNTGQFGALPRPGRKA